MHWPIFKRHCPTYCFSITTVLTMCGEIEGQGRPMKAMTRGNHLGP